MTSLSEFYQTMPEELSLQESIDDLLELASRGDNPDSISEYIIDLTTKMEELNND